MPQLLMDIGVWQACADLPNEERSTLRTAIIDTGYTKWTSLACGDERNDNAAPFTQSMWATRTSGQTTQMPLDFNVPISVALPNMPSMIWHSIVMGRAFGVKSTNGTTAATHSGGATAQIQIRWDDARRLGTCTLNGDNLTVNASCYNTPKP